jgi:hypothetical protein
MPVRRIPLSYRSHVTGYQPFIPGARSIGHESVLERDFVTICRFDEDVLGIEEQPVTINWIDADGHKHRYTPDYRVIRRTGAEIVEVKYRTDLWEKWANYKPAFSAARDWAATCGMRFRIVTDRQIRGPLLANARRLLPRMHDPVPAEIERQIVGTLKCLQPVNMSTLVEAVIAPVTPREMILSALWPMLARRTLITDLNVEIDGNSILSLPRAPS